MRSPAHPAALSLSTLLSETGRRIASLFRNIRNRRDVLRLAELDDRTLHDIGLTRSDVFAALAEPVHQDPSVRLLVRRIDARARERAAWPTAKAKLTLPSPAVCTGR